MFFFLLATVSSRVGADLERRERGQKRSGGEGGGSANVLVRGIKCSGAFVHRLPPVSLREPLAAASAPRPSFSGRAIEDRRHRRTSRSCVLREVPDVKRICYKLGLWVCSLSPRERAQAGHFCPAYASRYPCSFMNYKQGSGGWALLASARSLSAESGNRSGAGAKAAARRTFSSRE